MIDAHAGRTARVVESPGRGRESFEAAKAAGGNDRESGRADLDQLIEDLLRLLFQHIAAGLLPRRPRLPLTLVEQRASRVLASGIVDLTEAVAVVVAVAVGR